MCNYYWPFLVQTKYYCDWNHQQLGQQRSPNFRFCCKTCLSLWLIEMSIWFRLVFKVFKCMSPLYYNPSLHSFPRILPFSFSLFISPLSTRFPSLVSLLSQHDNDVNEYDRGEEREQWYNKIKAGSLKEVS